MTQERLAELINRSVDAVSNLERGISAPSYDTLVRLSESLGIPLAELSQAIDPGLAPDRERIALTASLSELVRSLPTTELRIAVEQVRILARYSRPD